MTQLESALSTATGWRRIGFAVLAGLFLALGQAPLSLPWGIFPAFAILAVQISHATPRHAAFTLWLAGASYFAASLTWIVEPFLVDVARHGWMAPFALIIMSGGLALFWAGAGAFACLVKTPSARAIFLAVTLALCEYARANILTGFPWGLLAYHWIDTPLAQSLAYIGPHGLGLISVLLGTLIALRFPFGLITSALLTTALWIGFATTTPEPKRDPEAAIIRIIQPNAAQRLKWKRENLQMFYERQLTLSASPGLRDLVIWPETAVPFLLDERPDLRAEMIQAALAPVVFGARRAERRADQKDAEGRAKQQGAEQGDRTIWFNSLGLLNSTGDLVAQYDKHHLVPFGEYLPFASTLNRLGLYALAQSFGGFGSGTGPQLIQSDTLPPFQALICYEAIFPNEMLPLSKRPAWLLHITNDAWFGTYSGPYQHLAQARARAIEQGLPLARSANTGISAMIDPWGRVLQSLPLGVSGYLDAALPKPRPATAYAQFGDWIALILGAIMTILARIGSLWRRIR